MSIEKEDITKLLGTNFGELFTQITWGYKKLLKKTEEIQLNGESMNLMRRLHHEV